MARALRCDRWSIQELFADLPTPSSARIRTLWVAAKPGQRGSLVRSDQLSGRWNRARISAHGTLRSFTCGDGATAGTITRRKIRSERQLRVPAVQRRPSRDPGRDGHIVDRTSSKRSLRSNARPCRSEPSNWAYAGVWTRPVLGLVTRTSVWDEDVPVDVHGVRHWEAVHARHNAPRAFAVRCRATNLAVSRAMPTSPSITGTIGETSPMESMHFASCTKVRRSWVTHRRMSASVLRTTAGLHALRYSNGPR